MNSYKYAKGETTAEKLVDAGASYAGSQASSFLLPNFVRGIASGLDDTVRDQYGGETAAQNARDSIAAGLPVLRQGLPAALDNFGRERGYSGNGALDFLNANLLPGQIGRYSQGGVEAELERLNRATGETGLYPGRSAPRSVTSGGETYKLSQEERLTYQRTRGQTALNTMRALLGAGIYQAMPQEKQAAVMADAVSYADAVAKDGLGLGYEPDKWVTKAQDMSEEDRAAFLAARVLLSDGGTTGEKRDILRGVHMPEDQKIQVYRALLSDTRDGDIQRVLDTGLSFDDFLEAQNRRAAIDDMDAGAGEKAAEFAHWAYQRGFEEAQVDALRDVFQFYSFVPADELRYDRLLEAGFREEEAYALSGALAGIGGIRGDRGADGETIPLSASRKKKEAIDAATPDLSVEQRRMLYELFGVSRSVWGLLPTR